MWKEYYRQRRIASYTLRGRFLMDCLEEQVLPESAPRQLRSDKHPFTESARVYLEEACKNLEDKVNELHHDIDSLALPGWLSRKLAKEYTVQSVKLKRELARLCEVSDWNIVGRLDLVLNLSDRRLSSTEKQVLSLGLKFDIGGNGKGFNEFINCNYKWRDRDADKGFTQGVVACYKALAQSNICVIPRRYKEALHTLSQDDSIIISQADKGGGVIVMNKNDYLDKMLDLLNDHTTYERKPDGNADNEAEKFKIEARNILRKSVKGKKLLGLLEEAPRPPLMHGLPKVHKTGMPMRPITSGIGSAPHKLAKRLAKPLSGTLGSISDAHLRNSSDLIRRLVQVLLLDLVVKVGGQSLFVVEETTCSLGLGTHLVAPVWRFESYLADTVSRWSHPQVSQVRQCDSTRWTRTQARSMDTN
ncbi:uncharacterized protein LOC143039251 [Oratosquilla oratoria]|uniref:uncharacterized protein LOC143039251 n=1 Tax=Oratosquilla oratoria TaxID=337810 RepID=UPI003F764574